MDYLSIIRKLARSNYYQTLYDASKESNINLFDNISNFSGLQQIFLYWLKAYDLLYAELHTKEWKYLDEAVINNDVRCDAFLYWRGLEKEKELNQYKQDKHKSKHKFSKPGKVTNFDVDFTNDK